MCAVLSRTTQPRAHALTGQDNSGVAPSLSSHLASSRHLSSEEISSTVKIFSLPVILTTLSSFQIRAIVWPLAPCSLLSPTACPVRTARLIRYLVDLTFSPRLLWVVTGRVPDCINDLPHLVDSAVVHPRYVLSLVQARSPLLSSGPRNPEVHSGPRRHHHHLSVLLRSQLSSSSVSLRTLSFTEILTFVFADS